MVARRLSHRVVAIGLFPPSSDSWHPTHSTHKFTRATASGESNFRRVIIGYYDHSATVGLMRSTTDVRPAFQKPENMSSTTLSGHE